MQPVDENIDPEEEVDAMIVPEELEEVDAIEIPEELEEEIIDPEEDELEDCNPPLLDEVFAGRSSHVALSKSNIVFTLQPYLVIPEIKPQKGIPLEVHTVTLLFVHVGFPLTQLVGVVDNIVLPEEEEEEG